MWSHGLRPRPIAFLLFLSLLLAQNALAQITANPAQGAVGTSVTVRGSGWTPNNVITFAWNFNSQVTIPGVRVDSNGNFTATISVPQGAPLGPTYITAGDQATF